MHLPDGIAIPFDQQTAAMGAEGIFTLIPGNVTTVNIFQSRCFTDFRGTLDSSNICSGDVVHFIAGIKTADMPWGLPAQRRNEGCDLLQQ